MRTALVTGLLCNASRTGRASLLGVVLALAALFGAPAARADTVAVLPLVAPDLLEPQKRAIEERVRALAAESGVALQPAGDTRRGIEEAQKAGAACNLTSLACQAQMGVLLGTDQVLVARVASEWAGDRLELRLLDALRGSMVREAARVLPKDAALRRRVVDGAILSVLAPAKTGAVSIAAAQGEVVVDGVPLPAGKTRAEGLVPGPHALELRVEGQTPLEKTVTVIAGETVSVTLGDVVTSEPPVVAPAETPLALWLVGGGAVLAAAAGAGAGGLQAALEYSAMERPSRDALQATGIGLLGATALGVVVAGAGGVMLAMEGAAP